MKIIIIFSILVFILFIYEKVISIKKNKNTHKNAFDKVKKINSVLIPTKESLTITEEQVGSSTSKNVYFIQPTPISDTFLVGRIKFNSDGNALIFHCQNTSSPNIQIWRRTGYLPVKQVVSWLQQYKVRIIKNSGILPKTVIEENMLPRDVLRFQDPDVARSIFDSQVRLMKNQYKDVK